MRPKSNNTFIDLFSGAGGLLRGFLDANFIPIFSVESWKPAIDTHLMNYPDIPLISDDIRNIDDEKLGKYINNVDLIIGGPPCQGFSTIGKRLKKDPRNELVFEFIRFVNIIRPKFFLMENVRGLISTNGGETKEAIKNEFENIGYHNVKYKVLCAADYGVPQLRYRVFYIGVRKDLNCDLNFPDPIYASKEYITVGTVINDLIGKENNFPNHIPMNHNKIVEERMKYIPEGSGIPIDGLPEEVAKGTRKDFRDNVIKNFSHVYKRLDRNRPANTMVPGHNAFPLHPFLNRSLTVREAARIQTFPDDVMFMGNRQNQCIQVGNAVPVKLAFELAKNFKKYLDVLRE